VGYEWGHNPVEYPPSSDESDYDEIVLIEFKQEWCRRRYPKVEVLSES
jgi:hypothetical protein